MRDSFADHRFTLFSEIENLLYHRKDETLAQNGVRGFSLRSVRKHFHGPADSF